MPKIAVLYDVPFPFITGGGQKRIYMVLKYLIRMDWEVHWYCNKSWDGEDEIIKDKIIYHGFPCNGKLYNNQGKRSFGEAVNYGRQVYKNSKMLIDFDIIWCGEWPLFHLIALIIKGVAFKKIVVVDWWETWGRIWFEYSGSIKGFAGYVLEIVLIYIYSRIGSFVSISKSGRLQMIKQWGNAKNIKLIPNGIDLNVISDYKAGAQTYDFIYFGRLIAHKNIDVLINALQYLNEDMNTGFTLAIIGDGPIRHSLETLCDDLNLTDNITFFGQVDDDRLFSLLKSSIIFVHPSTKEGGGSITLLEANACGLPVVCFNHPGGIDPSQIRHLKTGYIVEEFDYKSLSNGMKEIYEVACSEDIAQVCVQHVCENDWDEISEKYHMLFKSLIK